MGETDFVDEVVHIICKLEEDRYVYPNNSILKVVKSLYIDTSW